MILYSDICCRIPLTPSKKIETLFPTILMRHIEAPTGESTGTRRFAVTLLQTGSLRDHTQRQNFDKYKELGPWIRMGHSMS